MIRNWNTNLKYQLYSSHNISDHTISVSFAIVYFPWVDLQALPILRTLIHKYLTKTESYCQTCCTAYCSILVHQRIPFKKINSSKPQAFIITRSTKNQLKFIKNLLFSILIATVKSSSKSINGKYNCRWTPSENH